MTRRLLICVTVAGALGAQATKKGTLSGTIVAVDSMIEFSAEKGPARWNGITFKLREYPGRTFVFRAASFEHEGKNLVKDNLKGLYVKITYEKDPDESSYQVKALNFVSPPKPPASKPPAGK